MGDTYVNEKFEQSCGHHNDAQFANRAACPVQPLLHAIILVIQITMVSILVRKFNSHYANRPVLTTMITNAVRCSTFSPFLSSPC